MDKDLEDQTKGTRKYQLRLELEKEFPVGGGSGLKVRPTKPNIPICNH